jgi:PelA/Pel-15E family pectate lyase
VSLSGFETVGIVRFLMKVERPSPEIREAVDAAVAWLKRVQLTGLRLETISNEGAAGGKDVRVAADRAAPPLWARFYEIGTNRPIFSGRDAVIRYHLSEIELERRVGYRWYTSAPQALLDQEYPRWKKR